MKRTGTKGQSVAVFENRTSPNIDVERQIAIAAAVGQILAADNSRQTAIEQVLKVLEEQYCALCARVASLDPGNQTVRIEASRGACEVESTRHLGRGEEIMARIVQEEKPLVVYRRGSGDKGCDVNVAYICVPLIVCGNACGALSVVLKLSRDRRCEDDIRFLNLIAAMIAQALKTSSTVQREPRRLEEVRSDFSRIIGVAGPMHRVHRQIAQSAASHTPVLICGESGTGKELIARTIHCNSSRAKKPFIKVDCARFPRNLIESETGGGTLFLDEVGRMNVSAQAMFLRVLQEEMKDVRLIAGTSRKLESMVAEGTFRKDLYQRLNVSGIFVPPLRDRSTDLPLLANHFLRRSASEHKKDIRHISSTAIDRLAAYHWPDNIRELSRVIDHAVVVCDSKVVHGHHLPAKFQTFSPAGTPAALSLSDAVSAFEKNILLDALKTAGGNRSKAARLLGSTERIISYKVRKHGIDDTPFSN